MHGVQSECDTQGMEHAQIEREVPVYEGARAGEGTERAIEILRARIEEVGGHA